jgi:transcriptional regulator GlxA family with amidase domain
MSRQIRTSARILLAAVVVVAALAGIGAAGVATSMSQSFTDPPGEAAARSAPPVPIPPGRITVAVVVGATGTVAADALAPYEVFARSQRFFVYTVAADRSPAALSGGLHLLPDRTFADVTARPDVIVAPAVVDPAGAREAPLRAWLTEQAAHGSRVLGVCAGARVLAAAGLLDGRRATSHWSDLPSLPSDFPAVDWVRGQRYVEDGAVITTAGVTSGTIGALRLVEQLAGAGEADRIGTALAYPGWSIDGDTEIPEHRWALPDLPDALNLAFPWLRPTVGIGLTDGVSEIDVAAAAEAYSGASFAARAVPIGAQPTVTTRHGLVLLAQPVGAEGLHVDRIVVPGVGNATEVDARILRWAADHDLDLELPGPGAPAEFGFDPILRDLAQHADRATALATATYVEYPTGHLALTGPAWPWRPTALLAAALLVCLALGWGAARLLKRPRAPSDPDADLLADATTASGTEP